MNIGILSKRTTNFTAQMKNYYESKGFNVKIYTQKNLSINDTLIENDFFILKTKRLHFLYAGYFLESKGIPVIPNTNISFKCKNRIEASFLLKNLGFNVPQIFLGTYNALKNNLDKLSFPLISKPIMGSGSRGVKLINSFHDIKKDFKKIFYFEKFIVGIHYLVYFINDQLSVNEKMPLANEHASVKVIETPSDIRDIIFKWKKTYNLLFGHLDIVRETSSDKLYVVDPGSFPEFSNWKWGDELISGVCDLIIERYRSIKKKKN
ncbi:MAG: RimK family alpha-L-glutamate ligase [Candidatus Hermodarchaeota archaeon]